ncbi:MAG: repeat-like domain [Chloroflexota bacterium]|jgi:hypothetical protein|nr:repeat-like domain [Chloroflexota bacterium]
MPRGQRWSRALAVLAVPIAVAAFAWSLPARDAHADAPFTMGPAIRLPDADGGTEPRVAVGPDGTSWLISNINGNAVVYASTDKVTWTPTAGQIPGQSLPTIDVDIIVTRTGRVIANELDTTGLSIVTAYTDDRGATWHPSGGSSPVIVDPVGGTNLADQDRNWLASGPDDAGTHLPRVYHLYHNLGGGVANHNMFVQTSTDDGATFGPPIPVTLPPDQAYLDLQCADSGGPSNIMVNQVTGQVYAVFGTRSSVLGGCGASVVGPFEVNIVAATRVWVATATPESALLPGGWTQSLAVDDSATNQIVGMQLAPGTLDNAGNVYILYPESPGAYPGYDGSAVKYVHAGPDMATWSAPVTVVPAGTNMGGGLLTHIVAGDPGRLGMAWFQGFDDGNGSALWYLWTAETQDGLSDNPTIEKQQVSDVPTYHYTAAEMMGACGAGPANGFVCDRSTDVWGLTMRSDCSLQVTWPVKGPGGGAPPGADDTGGTYVATQDAGPRLCGAVTFPPATTATDSGTGQLPNTRNLYRAPTDWLPPALVGMAGLLSIAILVGNAGVRRRRGRP